MQTLRVGFPGNVPLSSKTLSSYSTSDKPGYSFDIIDIILPRGFNARYVMFPTSGTLLNGSWTEMFGQLKNNSLDMVTPRTLRYSRACHFNYTHSFAYPYRLGLLVNPTTESNVTRLVDALHWSEWLVFLACLTLLVATLHVYRNMPIKVVHSGLIQSGGLFYRVMFELRNKKFWLHCQNGKYLITMWALMIKVVLIIIRGNYINKAAMPFALRIDSWEELAEKLDSQSYRIIIIKTYSLYKFIQTSNDPAVKNLRSIFKHNEPILVEKYATAKMALRKPGMIFLSTSLQALMLQREIPHLRHYNLPAEMTLFQHFYVSSEFRKTKSFHLMNRNLLWLYHSGLTQRILTSYDVNVPARHQYTERHLPDTLPEFTSTFESLALGLGVAFFVVCMEILCAYLTKRTRF